MDWNALQLIAMRGGGDAGLGAVPLCGPREVFAGGPDARTPRPPLAVAGVGMDPVGRGGSIRPGTPLLLVPGVPQRRHV